VVAVVLMEDAAEASQPEPSEPPPALPPQTHSRSKISADQRPRVQSSEYRFAQPTASSSQVTPNLYRERRHAATHAGARAPTTRVCPSGRARRPSPAPVLRLPPKGTEHVTCDLLARAPETCRVCARAPTEHEPGVQRTQRTLLQQ
jgi:hypothetical protein